MMRPSDIAPKAIHYDNSSADVRPFYLNVQDVVFEGDSMVITFHRIKNDSQRRGFIVTIQDATEPKLSPVRCMRSYIHKTICFRDDNSDPIFLILTRPVRPLSASTVSNILAKSLQIAGLEGYKPNDFRPTGATTAVEACFDEHTIMKVGRWKCNEMFREHYIHNRIPQSFTDEILNS